MKLIASTLNALDRARTAASQSEAAVDACAVLFAVLAGERTWQAYRALDSLGMGSESWQRLAAEPASSEEPPPAETYASVLVQATAEARGLGQTWVGTEHLLLGLVHQVEARPNSRAAQQLRERELDLYRVRQVVASLNGIRLSGQPARPAARTRRLTTDAGFSNEVEALGASLAEPAPALPLVRSHFAQNRFLGWWIWLEAYRRALAAGDFRFCGVLEAELTAGYALTPHEEAALSGWASHARYREGGRDLLWQTWERRLARAAAEDNPLGVALARRWLGIIFQEQRLYDAAGLHYKRSEALFALAGAEDQAHGVRALQFGLEEQARTGEVQPAFTRLWEAVVSDPQPPEREVTQLAASALERGDFPGGLEALAAGERLGSEVILQAGLASASAGLRMAAVCTLRRSELPQRFRLLTQALEDSAPLVRWQAASGLGRSGASAAEPLRRRLLRESDADVRSAIAAALAQVGGRESLPQLCELAGEPDTLGVEAAHAGAAAVRAIEQRLQR